LRWRRGPCHCRQRTSKSKIMMRRQPRRCACRAAMATVLNRQKPIGPLACGWNDLLRCVFRTACMQLPCAHRASRYEETGNMPMDIVLMYSQCASAALAQTTAWCPGGLQMPKPAVLQPPGAAAAEASMIASTSDMAAPDACKSLPYPSVCNALEQLQFVASTPGLHIESAEDSTP
jgi:hypothetical protein